MINETYACCVYLPPSTGLNIEMVIVKHPKMKGVDYIGKSNISTNFQHMSINKLVPKIKNTKKEN